MSVSWGTTRGDRPKLAITRYVGRVVHVAVGVLYPDMDAMTLGTD